MNEIKQKYQDKLGEDFGAIFYGVWNDWLTGLLRLKEYRVLFTDHDAVKLLNSVSGGPFMWDVQHILWDDLLLHVTRLTDPATTGRRKNLSVQALPPFCGRPGLQAEHPKLQAQVQALVDQAEEAAEFARPWRNRRISHADLGLAIDSEAESLAPTSLGQVQAAQDAVHAVIGTISSEVLKEEVLNDVVIAPRAAAFLAYVKQLVTAVQYVDSIIDPSGDAPLADVDVADAFLAKLDRRPGSTETLQVIELREAAQRFS